MPSPSRSATGVSSFPLPIPFEPPPQPPSGTTPHRVWRQYRCRSGVPSDNKWRLRRRWAAAPSQAPRLGPEVCCAGEIEAGQGRPDRRPSGDFSVLVVVHAGNGFFFVCATEQQSCDTNQENGRLQQPYARCLPPTPQNLPYPMYPPPSQLPQSYEQLYNGGQAFHNYAMYPPTTIDLESPRPQPIPPPWHPAWFSQNYMHPGAVNQPPGKRSRAKKAAASEGGSHRQENFSIEEDKLLCSAFVYVSKDPIVGVNQSGEAYWERIQRYFNDNNCGRTYRNSGSLSKRWQKIQLAVSKFCGYKAAVDRANPSGMTQQDRIEEAKTKFHELHQKPFKFMHCWEILRTERKWLDHIARNRKDDEDEHMEVSTDHANTSTEPAETPQTRPMGRDSAKKRRSSDSAYSNASSAFLEVMQQIGTSRDKKMEMYAAYMSARKEEREARQAEQEARKAEMAARNEEARQRELAIQEQQQRLMAEREENKVMLCDPSNFNEVQWEWLRVKQQRYLKRLREEEQLGDEAAGAGGIN